MIRITGDDPITAFRFFSWTLKWPYRFRSLILTIFLDRKVLVEKLSLRFVPFLAANILKVATESRFKSILSLVLLHYLLDLSLTTMNTAWRCWWSWLRDEACLCIHIRVSWYIWTDIKLVYRFLLRLVSILDRRLSIIWDESLLRGIIFRLKNRCEVLFILVFVFFFPDKADLVDALVQGWTKLD